MQTKRVLGNVLVLGVSLALSLLVGEMAARIIVNPADYLAVTMEQDAILGMKIADGQRGFDRWGFRNPSVPSRADVVAIGDSHTYGNTATMAESWPYVAARLTGLSVYNLGLGGYGPNQYYHLFLTRALVLEPRWVFCGLYMGDDFENAFSMTYGTDYWAFLGHSRRDGAKADIWGVAETSSWGRSLRAWFARHSVVYQVVVHGPVLGMLKGDSQIKRASRDETHTTTSLTVPEVRIQEAFRPIGIWRRVDQRSSSVREGMRITFDLLARMNDACRKQGCRLVVVVIPTKESVFADLLTGRTALNLAEAIRGVIVNEESARVELLAFLENARIPYVDTLPPLRSRLGERLYARSDRDMHPSKNGYRVIGEAVAQFLRERS